MLDLRNWIKQIGQIKSSRHLNPIWQAEKLRIKQIGQINSFGHLNSKRMKQIGKINSSGHLKQI